MFTNKKRAIKHQLSYEYIFALYYVPDVPNSGVPVQVHAQERASFAPFGQQSLQAPRLWNACFLVTRAANRKPTI